MKMNQKIIYVLLSVSAERRNQERPCCTLRVRQNVVLHTVLRDSLRSNRSSHLLRSRVQSPHFIPSSPAIATCLTITGCFATLPCFRVGMVIFSLSQQLLFVNIFHFERNSCWMNFSETLLISLLS